MVKIFLQQLKPRMARWAFFPYILGIDGFFGVLWAIKFAYKNAY